SNTGELISDNTIAGGLPGADPAVTLADLDGQGYAEIIVGGRVFVLEKLAGRLTVAKTFVGDKMQGINNGQGAVSCAADLDGDGRLEIVAGGTAYKLPRAPEGGCPGDLGALAPEQRAFCENKLHVMWDKGIEGFCAVADVLSKPETPEPPTDLAHPLDGKPEVVLVAAGHLRIFDGLSGAQRLDVVVAPSDGGPPNIDDFDGDGFPEIGTAFANYYTMYDLQPATAACPAWPSTLDGVPNSTAPVPANGARMPPSVSCSSHDACGDTNQFACSPEGSCVCLHNAWKSVTQDASSRVTGSSVFDFNGDGAAEVVYNDECYFRIYEGKSGRVYQRLDSQSPTRIEYPVVADVDSDGNAEIVFSGSNARSEHCPNQGSVRFLDGINVIGDPTDRWVSARRIWNQHAYHVTNVLEQGTVPSQELPNWSRYNGRSYNVYRSNLPPYGHVAPDLSVLAVQVSSPNVVCGEALSTDIRIAARIVNQGDLRVGENVSVRFVDQADQLLGEKTLGVALEPGAETFVSLDYHAPSQAALPTRVKVLVDAEQAERECNEDNNRNEATLTVKEQMPELSLTLSALNNGCPSRQLRISVKNDGQTTVPSVGVRLFAGNPSEGGTLLSAHTVGPIAPASSATLDVAVDVGSRDVTVYGVVDPERKIAECDDGNNTATLDV
ncbi:MAG TPA: FG-GAP-like repeat-containing protein, partial [Polyangiales bacterium]